MSAYENKLNSISCYPAQNRLTSVNKDSFIHMRTDLFLGPAGLDPGRHSKILDTCERKNLVFSEWPSDSDKKQFIEAIRSRVRLQDRSRVQTFWVRRAVPCFTSAIYPSVEVKSTI